MILCLFKTTAFGYIKKHLPKPSSKYLTTCSKTCNKIRWNPFPLFEVAGGVEFVLIWLLIIIIGIISILAVVFGRDTPHIPSHRIRLQLLTATNIIEITILQEHLPIWRHRLLQPIPCVPCIASICQRFRLRHVRLNLPYHFIPIALVACIHVVVLERHLRYLARGRTVGGLVDVARL